MTLILLLRLPKKRKETERLEVRMRENIYKCDVSTEDGATSDRKATRETRHAGGARGKTKGNKKAKETKCKSASSLRAKRSRE
jgi:hypothetical protein